MGKIIIIMIINIIIIIIIIIVPGQFSGAGHDGRSGVGQSGLCQTAS